MKRIALIGAPGSGKTELASALAERWPPSPILLRDEDGEYEGERTLAVVDGYVQRLMDDTGVAYGHFAGYINNLQVAFERLRWEQGAEYGGHADADRPRAMITCGTLVETTLYVHLHARQILTAPTLDDEVAEITRADSTAKVLAQLVAGTWNYDHVYVLPYPDDDREPSWDVAIDAGLVAGLDAFFLRYEMLEQNETIDDWADRIVSEVHAKAE